MSFWGIQVKPGKLVTHYFDPRRGRLRISRATMDIGDGIAKSIVLCNVRNKIPVFLCTLLPNKTESCHLDLEFEETDDVIFSVLGQRSVHLTGYYVRKILRRNDSDTESFGEDIANTDNEVSNWHNDEDDYDYDDSFINDDYESDALPSSLASSDENRGKHLENRKGNRKRLKKKYKAIIESEEDNNSQESEDEDNCHSKIPAKKYYIVESEDDNNAHESKGEENCLLSVFKNETLAKATSSKCREKTGKLAVEANGQAENSGEDDREENVDAMDMTSMSNISKDQFISGIDNHILAPEDDSGIGKTTMPNKFKDAKSLEVGVRDQEDMYTNRNIEQLAEFDKEHQVELPAEEQVENISQLTKNGSEEMRLHECKDSGPGNDVEEVMQVVEATNMDKDLLATEDNELTYTNRNIEHLAEFDKEHQVELPAEEQVENSSQLTKNGSEEMRLHECKDSPGNDVEEVMQVVEATDMDRDLLATEDNELTNTQNIVDHFDSLEPHAEVKAENGQKLKKGSEGVRLNECKVSSPGDAAVEEVKLVVEGTNMDTNLLATTEDIKVPTSIQNFVDRSDSLKPHVEGQAEHCPNLKKRKKGSKGVKLNESKDSSIGDILEEDKQIDETTDVDKDLLATAEDNKVLTSTKNVVDHSDSLEPHAEGQAERRPKLKKRKKGSNGVKLNESKDSSIGDILEEAKQIDETTDVDKDLLVTAKDNDVLTTTGNVVDRSDSLEPHVEGQAERRPKLKKRKEASEEVKLNESKDSSTGDTLEEAKLVDKTSDVDKDLLAMTEDNKVLTSTRNVVDRSDSLVPHAEGQAERRPKLKKRKKGSKGVKLNESKDSSTSDILEEAKQIDETTDVDKDLLATAEDNKVLTSTRNVVDRSESLVPHAEGQAERRPKLKKRKKGCKGVKLNESKDSSIGDILEEAKQIVETTDVDKDLLATAEDNKVLTSTRNVVDRSDSLEPHADGQAERRPILKKRKEASEGVKLNDSKDSSIGDTLEEAKLVYKTTDVDKDLLAMTEDNKVLTSIRNVVDRSDSLEPHAEGHAECRPKLKKRKEGSEGVKLNESKDSSTGDTLEEAKTVDKTTNVDKDFLAMTEDNKVLTSTRSIDVADGSQPEKELKKKKKKKTKLKDADTTSIRESDMTENEIFGKCQDKGPNPESSQVRTLSNGVTIEDLAKGKADGKVATLGRKVKVYCTCMLKENGHVFCSNIGEAAYEFCLGDKNVVKGLSIGVEGMRVGDKRRLTIPPTMGYGSKGLGEDIPPNAWLIFEVELVGVRL